MCMSKIYEASAKGRTSCHLISGDEGDLTEQNKKLLLNVGYDLRWTCFTSHGNSYFVTAIWDDTATGKLIIEQ